MIGPRTLELNQTVVQGGTIKAVSMFSLLISHPVAAWVKNLVVKKHNLPVTKIVDDIMEQIQGNDKDKDSIF